MLLVCAGEYTYAIHTKYVTEVIPQVKITKIPQVPDYILGHINFGGKPIPVADLSLLINAQTSRPCMHTRIVLLQPTGVKTPLFGLLAEKVTEAIEINETAFAESGVHPISLSFFGGISNEKEMAIQQLDVDKLYAFLKLGGTS